MSVHRELFRIFFLHIVLQQDSFRKHHRMKVNIQRTFENVCLALQQTQHRIPKGALLHDARVAWEAHKLNLDFVFYLYFRILYYLLIHAYIVRASVYTCVYT